MGRHAMTLEQRAVKDTAHMVERILTRRASMGDTPAGRLLIAVIRQAWIDAGVAADEWTRAEARRFFNDGRGDALADLAGYGRVSGLYRSHHPACAPQIALALRDARSSIPVQRNERPQAEGVY